MADIAKWMRDVDNQLRKLATAARANFTDVRGGFTRWLLANGNSSPRISIGASTNDADVGVYVYDDDNALAAYLGTAAADGAQLLVRNPDKTGSVINIHAGRWARPLLSAAWQFDPIDADYGAIANGYAEVSSGTYTRCWATFLPITSGGIYSSIVVDRTGTAVVDCRIRVTDFPAGSTVTLVEVTGVTGTVFLPAPWTVPTSMTGGDSPIGTLALVEIEVRVASGSGLALVAPRTPAVNWLT